MAEQSLVERLTRIAAALEHPTVAYGIGETMIKEAIRDALAALGEKDKALRECVAALYSDAMKSIWSFLYAHGWKYDGPVVDMIKARAALTAPEDKP